MFVEDEMVVEAPYDAVVARVSADPKAILSAALGAAISEGDSLRARVGPTGRASIVSKTVEVRTGPVRLRDECVLLALSWEAASGAAFVPSLDADLELTPEGIGYTLVVLRARYEPPGGAVGRQVDSLLLHRVAEATMRAFLGRVCIALSGTAPPGAAEAS